MRLGTVKPVPVFRLLTVHDERSGGVRLVIGVIVVEYPLLAVAAQFRTDHGGVDTSRRIDRIIRGRKTGTASPRFSAPHCPRRAVGSAVASYWRFCCRVPLLAVAARFRTVIRGIFPVLRRGQATRPRADVQGCVIRRIMRLGTVKPVPVFRLPTVHGERSGRLWLVIGVSVVEYRSLQSRLSLGRTARGVDTSGAD